MNAPSPSGDGQDWGRRPRLGTGLRDTRRPRRGDRSSRYASPWKADQGRGGRGLRDTQVRGSRNVVGDWVRLGTGLRFEAGTRVRGHFRSSWKATGRQERESERFRSSIRLVHPWGCRKPRNRREVFRASRVEASRDLLRPRPRRSSVVVAGSDQLDLSWQEERWWVAPHSTPACFDDCASLRISLDLFTARGDQV